ncbi:MAG: hypothetical protein Q8N13_19520 [Acidovorax sp.]|nr:hypothetical protein [Acidovorax sp.]
MTVSAENLGKLRNIINENLRTQVSNDEVAYVSYGHTLTDVSAKQSHCIFARRGCGKTLLLHQSQKQLPSAIKAIYINCEDFKHHSFPNVLLQILHNVFTQLEGNLSRWFPRQRRLKTIVGELRTNLDKLKDSADDQNFEIREAVNNGSEVGSRSGASISTGDGITRASGELSASRLLKNSVDTEKKYRHNENKLRELNLRLPEYKEKIKEFFSLSSGTDAIFIQIDDFYHLNRTDQPYVADYIHRLCKDTLLKFKIATLKHNSVLYIERNRQPIGIQERHDYQPINIDFTFEQFDRTRDQNRGIFHEYARRAGLNAAEFDALFKGQGFDRLILAGGGVPRDCLSFFLEVLDSVRTDGSDGKIGKDEVRFLSRQTFERRIDELKQDSEGQDQEALLRGIYAIRAFCLDRKSNVFLVAENEIQKDDDFKTLLYRLMDYRIIHQVAKALTHKSLTGPNFQAFAIDIGCYAYMRNLQGRFSEIDLTQQTAREKMRSAPVLEAKVFRSFWAGPTGQPIETALVAQESE